jgi:hypothetical protein
LGTLISHGIFIFPREISSFSLGKMKISWEISVPKLALKENPAVGRSGRSKQISTFSRLRFHSLRGQKPRGGGGQSTTSLSPAGRAPQFSPRAHARGHACRPLATPTQKNQRPRAPTRPTTPATARTRQNPGGDDRPTGSDDSASGTPPGAGR